ncbi:MAG: septation protein SpoVG family protein [Planctomycetota bacterium]
MEITEIRIKLMAESEDRLRAFCSITIDSCFVIRDLKIIDGTNGPFVAMPSRKLTGHCQRCRHKNHLRAQYCNHCGVKLKMDVAAHLDSPQKLYADVAHPINSQCREMIQTAVIAEFDNELELSRQPGYRSRYDDDFDYPDAGDSFDDAEVTAVIDQPQNPGPPRPHFDGGPGGRPAASISRSPDDAPRRSEQRRDEGDEGGFGAGVF